MALTKCPRCCRPLERPHQVGLTDPHHERCHNRSRPFDAFCMTGPERAAFERYKIQAADYNERMQAAFAALADRFGEEWPYDD